MKDHKGEPLPLSAIAKHAGQSVSWLEACFKRETGQSIGKHLMQMRMQEAKDLLHTTNLSVTEIAFDVGFNSYTRFAIAFRNLAGMSPSQYRASAQELGEAPSANIRPVLRTKNLERFRDTFETSEIQSCWRKGAGLWNQTKGMLTGKSDEEFVLTYIPPLPENFAIEFEFRFESNPHLRVLLHGESRHHRYMEIEIGRYGHMGEMILANSDHVWIEQVDLKCGEWQSMRVELIDDTVRLYLDAQLIGEHKDPFPPSFVMRSNFSLAGWGTTLMCKYISIIDRGFMPLVRSVRQVDSLYGNEVHDRAAEGYMRLLAATAEPTEVAELQYKIGMCHLRQNCLTQARAWFTKIAATAETEFWFGLAQQGLLEANHLSRDYANFVDTAKKLFTTAKYRNAVRNGIARAAGSQAQAGFYNRALELSQTLYEVETPKTFLSYQALMPVADALFVLRDYQRACEAFKKIGSAWGILRDAAVMAKVEMADVLSYAGRQQESERVLLEICQVTQNQFVLARCEIVHAQNLCAKQRFTEAIAFLLESPERNPAATDIGAFALLRASQIYSQLGRIDLAEETFAETAKRFRGNALLHGYYGGFFKYPLLFAAGKHAEAAEVLLESSKIEGVLHLNANQMILAGILIELSGDQQRAVRIWEETSRRFPPARCCYYGQLAHQLAHGNGLNVDEMPYSALHRAEMFYLIGMLLRKRGAFETARNLFSLAVKNDPTMNWFTAKAKEEVQSSIQ